MHVRARARDTHGKVCTVCMASAHGMHARTHARTAHTARQRTTYTHTCTYSTLAGWRDEMARNGEYCPPNTLMRLRSTTEFHSVSCCGDSGQLVYHNAERVNSTRVGAECVFPANKIVQCEVVNERLVLANLWARHFEWKISNTPELYSLAKCKWHIPMPAFVWGFGHDDVFGHWVGESLFALFHTIEEFWVRALKRQPSVDEFRRNFLIRWEDEGQWCVC